MNAFTNALYIDDSSTVNGFTVLIFVPPFPLLSIFRRVVLSGTGLELTTMDVTPMKYSVDFSPAEDTPAVLTGLMKSGV